MAAAVDAPPDALPQYLDRVPLAASIGAAVEWYDFFLCGTAAALVFGKMFSGKAPLLASVAAFASFSIAYVARPLGVLFGHFGDRLGRKQMLVMALTIIGLGTFSIGLLLRCSVIGVWAPLLLSFLGYLQSIGLSGECGGAVLPAVESSPASFLTGAVINVTGGLA